MGGSPTVQPLAKSDGGAAAHEEEEAGDPARAKAQREAGAFLAYQQRKLVASTPEQPKEAAALPSPTSATR